MSAIKKYIPNTITCGNLLCGCFAIIYTLRNQLELAVALVFIAAVLDFLDGFTARLLHAYSSLGKELDSLADMVTFGVVPGLLLFQLMKQQGIAEPFAFIAFLIPVFSCLRLAKFNIDTRQTTSFIGLPTPANTIFICSLVLISIKTGPSIAATLITPVTLVMVSIIFSILLVSEIPLFSLKFKSMAWSANRIQYIFLGLSGLMLVSFFYLAIPMVIILYVVLSLVNNYLLSPKAERSNTEYHE